MVRVFLVACVLLLFSVQPLKAQDEPIHSIDELSTLLQKSNADTARIDLLLEAALVYVLKPGEEKHDLDSALFFTTEAMNISNRLNLPVWQARCFYVYSQVYRESHQKEKGKSYIERAIPLFAKYGRKERLGDAYFELQLYYNLFSDSEFVIKVKYAEQAERLYEQAGNKLKQATMLKHLGDFYQINEKDSIALKDLHKSLDIFQSVHYPKVEGVYDLIGYILFNEGDFHQALKYGLLALQTAESVKADSRELSTIYNRLGLIYYRLTQYQEADHCFTHAFSIAVGNKDTLGARVIVPNVMNTLLRLEKQQELLTFLQHAKFLYDKEPIRDKAIYNSTYTQAYLLTGNYKKAEPYVRELLRLASDSPDVPLLRNLHRAVIPFYLASGQYHEMYKYLPVNDSICRRYHIISGLVENSLWWFKADSALRDYVSAIVHYKQYKEASDSSLRLTTSQQINQLLIQYESIKKDQAIASKESNILLLTNQAKLQQEQLRRTRVVRNLTFSLIALLLVIVGLLFNGYRTNQRGNRKLQLQQREINDKNTSLQHLVHQKEKLLVEKEWLLKEVHHRVKNNMQIVMSLLNTQSAYLESDALTAIKESQHRMQAMSLIHQKLYQADNVALINMPSYIRELTGFLRESYDSGRYIQCNLDLEEINLDVSQAVPVGLILNEAITNVIKYAFPGRQRGTIDVVMKKVAGSGILLSISDNGIGLPTGPGAGKKYSFGMNLIRGLTGQLGGTINIVSDNGLCVQIAFPLSTVMKPAPENELSMTI
ncbi:histidine kinase dimerization/phosphoacceptor domain -containing protein [Flavitalea sp. BT771]|uniref:tetratricopeptide repeat-containing sensor histidine kinase n=1 Tax=Flavitalea sp. BT771 TaxID=3063329 RepID=UPI0026E2DA8D|nr:histidine kinase dimerization/phosphoacceptor domain -containing protein [Flavitalea sp. BT771]MDO6429584.1 histidine kinase dimerization/phosphoacceptor domain -containing protein [Flavitalea sp. BT771]MDV6218288.1 histidine kinase dimerization/phosphoacceptor domain -containing protein [Flavitalea sp. BT771]